MLNRIQTSENIDISSLCNDITAKFIQAFGPIPQPFSDIRILKIVIFKMLHEIHYLHVHEHPVSTLQEDAPLIRRVAMIGCSVNHLTGELTNPLDQQPFEIQTFLMNLASFIIHSVVSLSQ